MNTLYFKSIFFLILLLMPSFAFLSFGTYFNIKTYKEQRTLSKSYELQKTLQYLSVSRLSYTKLRQLQRIRARLSNKKQQARLSQIIRAHQHKQRYTLRNHIKKFIRGEQKINLQRKSKIQQFISKSQFNIIGFLVSFCIGAFLYAIFLKRKIFVRLQKVNRIIDSFINGEYDCKFNKMEQNEIGNLHTSFHSLAQIITNQMDKLKQLDKAKSDFVSIASHELKTPLTSIKGSLSLISAFINHPEKNQNNKLNLKEQLKELTAIAEGETDRIIRMVNQLLDIAKIGAGKFQLNKKWFFIHEMMKSCIESVYGLSQKAQVKINVVSQKDLEDFRDQVQIFADPDCLKQVMINFLSNAIKYSNPNQEIQVEWSIDENGEVKIEVKDQGVGISKDIQGKIFDKFVQATGSDNNSKLMKSTGLGLAIAKDLIEEHGGKIGFISEVGAGSNFYFILPKWQLYKKPSIQNQEKEETTKPVEQIGQQITGQIEQRVEQQIEQQVEQKQYVRKKQKLIA